MGDVIQTLAEASEPIHGVTSHDDRLYVLRGNESEDQIEVYDSDSFCFLHCLHVPNLGFSVDIVASGRHHCAYVSDATNQSVHRVKLTGSAVTDWPVYDMPSCLSLTVKHSVLVTCHKASKIKEFTMSGQLLREMQLSQDILLPWHTAQLSNGEFVVCHGDAGDPLHRVCLVNYDEQVLTSYGNHRGSGSQLMNTPSHIAVDRSNFVFVLDRNNWRVLLLCPMLKYVREVISSEELEWKPFRMSLDVKRGRLYVAVNKPEHRKYTAGRIVVVSV